MSSDMHCQKLLQFFSKTSGWILTKLGRNDPCLVLFKIEIKHDFLFINICWAPKMELKPEPESTGLNQQKMSV